MLLSHSRHGRRNVKRRARDTLSCPPGRSPTERRCAAAVRRWQSTRRRRRQEVASVSRAASISSLCSSFGHLVCLSPPASACDVPPPAAAGGSSGGIALISAYATIGSGCSGCCGSNAQAAASCALLIHYAAVARRGEATAAADVICGCCDGNDVTWSPLTAPPSCCFA